MHKLAMSDTLRANNVAVEPRQTCLYDVEAGFYIKSVHKKSKS